MWKDIYLDECLYIHQQPNAVLGFRANLPKSARAERDQTATLVMRVFRALAHLRRPRLP